MGNDEHTCRQKTWENLGKSWEFSHDLTHGKYPESGMETHGTMENHGKSHGVNDWIGIGNQFSAKLEY